MVRLVRRVTSAASIALVAACGFPLDAVTKTVTGPPLELTEAAPTRTFLVGACAPGLEPALLRVDAAFELSDVGSDGARVGLFLEQPDQAITEPNYAEGALTSAQALNLSIDTGVRCEETRELTFELTDSEPTATVGVAWELTARVDFLDDADLIEVTIDE